MELMIDQLKYPSQFRARALQGVSSRRHTRPIIFLLNQCQHEELLHSVSQIFFSVFATVVD